MSYKIDSSIRARYYGSSNRGNPKYIVLHYTGNSGTSATAKGNANYFHTCTRKASAHYVVDENATIYQCVPDNRAAWAVGDSSNGHGTFYGKCTNTNSISIEMVSHSNGSYYIPDATIQRASELTRDLMKKYGINADHVIRHYDVTTKACPEPMCGTTAKNKKWAAFKALLTTTVTALYKTVQIKSADGSLNVRSGPGTSYSVIGSLSNGKTADVVGVSGNWYKIKYGSRYGYISSAYTADAASTATNNTSNQEDDDNMKYYKNLTDIPSYYKTAIQKLVNSGAMKGTGNGELNVSEDFCRMATVLDSAGILDLTAPTVYKTIDDVPTYYRTAVQKLIDKGAISGTGNGELNLGADICRALTILDNAHLLDAVTLADVEITGEEVREENCSE